MRKAFLRLLLVLYLVPWSWAANAGFSSGLTGEILFAEGSVFISRVEMDKLDYLVCQLSNRTLNVAILVGHADPNEKEADHLAQLRVSAVGRALIARGIPFEKVYSESKGSTRPAPRIAGQATTNRRVEYEIVAMFNENPSADCHIQWKHLLSTLDVDRALIVAKSLVREDGIAVVTPFLEAVNGKRPDLLMALLRDNSGLRLNSADQRVLIEAAARIARPDMISIVIGANKLQPNDAPLLSRALSRAACAYANEPEKLESVRLLLSLGVTPQDSHRNSDYPPLDCAASSGSMALVDELLAAGADPNVPEGLVVNVGRNRDMVLRLLKAGANPTGKSNQTTWEGRTLFHTFKLDMPTDIAWLQSLGLDINSTDRYGNAPLHSAVGYANESLLDAMLKAGARIEEKKQGALLSEASRSNPQAVAWLIRHGVPLGHQGDLLTLLATKGEAIIPAMAALVERGVDLNQRSRADETALAVAISHFHPKLVSFLLQAGASQNNVRKGATALQIAEQLHPSIPFLPVCNDCPSSKPLTNTVSSPPLSPELVQRKTDIIELLKATR
jgi:ankyrin repeat protein